MADGIILVHDWLTGMRGGEKVLESFCDLWPDAPLYTLLHRAGKVSPIIEDRRIRTSFLQHLPAVHRYYRALLPAMPFAVNWRLPDCRVVVSSSHCVAKAVTPPNGVPHVSYCHSPMRYVWHLRDSYKVGAGMSRLKSAVVDRIARRLRDWDRRTAERVTHFIANSRTVQARIRDCYGRESRVIYPPVDTGFYTPTDVKRGSHYLVVSAFAPYKRVELAIRACKQLGRELVIIGTGQQEKQLRAEAGPNVRFLGWQSDEAIRDAYRTCRALLFPGEEDFGIVPVEANACGCPVIAFGRGGATETIAPLGEHPEPTGVWFAEQTEACLIAAMERLEAAGDSFGAARRSAERFGKARFRREIAGSIAEAMQPLRQAA